MKNKYTYFAALAASGIMLMALPLLANAQTRMQNAAVNRDYRNVELNQSADVQTNADVRTMSTSTRPGFTQRAAAGVRLPLIMPKWFSDPASPWKNDPSLVASMSRLRQSFANSATSTEFKNRDAWKSARLDKFALLQSNLTFELTQSLRRLRAVRVRLASRIAKAEQSGLDMTTAKSLLTIADQKIIEAAKAVNAVSSYVPTIAPSTKNPGDESSSVPLDKPRELGRMAIQALNDTKKALSDVVAELTRSLGLNIDETSTSTTP